MEEPKKQRSGCRKAVGIGCAILSAIAVLVLLLVLLNLDEIKDSDWFKSIREGTKAAQHEFPHMMKLQAELAAEYPAKKVEVNFHSRLGKVVARSLEVQFTNPRFEIGGAGAKTTAREIAVKVAHRYPEIDRFDQVVIEVVKKQGIGLTFGMTVGYEFSTSELLTSDASGVAPPVDVARYDEAAGKLFVEEFRRALDSPAAVVEYDLDFESCGGVSGVVGGPEDVMSLRGPEDVRELLAAATWLAPDSWHHCYDVYGCELSGQVTGETHGYTFEIDAGGAGTLSHAGVTIYFGHPQMADCDHDGVQDGETP